MRCVICRQVETQPGRTTVTLERDGMTVVIKGVPALVCPNCGEDYVDEETTEHVLQVAEELDRAGTLVEIRQYMAPELDVAA